MFDVILYGLFVLVIIGLLRHVMNGVEQQEVSRERDMRTDSPDPASPESAIPTVAAQVRQQVD